MDAVTFETLADDVEAIRRHLGIDEWILLGHSIHAQIAMAYADKYPARTSRLVLIAGVPFGLVELNSIADRFWNEQASKERQRQHVVNRTAIQNVLSVTRPSRQFVVNYFGDAAKFWADPTYDAAWLWKDVETSPVFERLAGKLPSPSEARSMLQRLQMPTLVMLGKLDYAIPYVAWEQVIDGLQNLDYTLLTEDSHNPQTESPERFDRALIDWLEN